MTFKISKKDAARLGLSGIVDGRTTPERRALQSVINHRDYRSYRSGLERRYAELLESRKIVGEIVAWQYECVKLHLGGGAWYLPDFVVIRDEPDGRRVSEIHEVKGFWREAAKVRLKVAVEKFWWFDFFVVYAGGKKGGSFEIERWSK